MRTFLLTLAFTLLSSTLLRAQEVTISDYTKVSDRYDLFVIGGGESGVFMGIGDDYYHNGFSNKQMIGYYDFRDREQKSKIVRPEKKSREYFYTFYFQDQLHLLQYDEQPSGNGQYGVYLECYDQSLDRIGEEQNIGQFFPYIFNFEIGSFFQSYFSNQYGKMRRSFFFNHKTSTDQKKLALLFNYNVFSQAMSEFQVIVLDENKQVAWSDLVDLPDSKASYRLLEDYAVSNDGILYMLMTTYDNKNFKKSAAGFKYSLYAYNPISQSVKAIDFATNDLFIINLGLELNLDQQPVLAGVYADAMTNDILGGVRIQEGQCTTFAFGEAEVTEINTRQDKEYAEEYTVKNVILEGDGSAIFFAESYKRGPIIKPKLNWGG